MKHKIVYHLHVSSQFQTFPALLPYLVKHQTPTNPSPYNLLRHPNPTPLTPLTPLPPRHRPSLGRTTPLPRVPHRHIHNTRSRPLAHLRPPDHNRFSHGTGLDNVGVVVVVVVVVCRC